MSSSDISWGTVGVACAFNVVSTVAIVLLAFVIIRRKYKLVPRNKFNESKLTNVSLELTPRRPSDRSIVTHVTEVGEPLLGRSVSHQPPAKTQDQRSGMLPPARRTNYGDFIASWCTEHGLTEQTAQVLRDAGFTSIREIESLNPAHVDQLPLTKLSQKSLLLKIISQRDSQKYSQHADVSTSSTSSQRDNRPSQRLSDPKPSGRQRVDSSSFKKSDDSGIDGNGKGDHSFDLSGESNTNMQPVSSSGRRSRSRNNSSETEGRPSRPHLGATVAGAVGVRPNYESNNNNKFHGLLSDKGLYQIADDLGMEWYELACALRVPSSAQDHFCLNHPNNARDQIVSMLRWWRDRQDGDKVLVKGTLQRALQTIGKNNIAEKILKEEVHGSSDNIKYRAVF